MKSLLMTALVGALLAVSPGCDEATCSFDFPIAVSLDGAPQFGAQNGAVTLNGRLDSDGRIDLLSIGDVIADASRDNYGRWQATLPNTVLQGYRVGTHADLKIVATDICGIPHDAGVVSIPVVADLGTPAPGLQVGLKPTQKGECYIPVSGVETADVSVTATGEAAGVIVHISHPAGTQVLGTDSDGDLILEPSEVGSSQSASLRASGPTSAGVITIAVSAGSSAALSDPLIIADTPTFSPADDVVLSAGEPKVVTVKTSGRFARCEIIATAPTHTHVALASAPADNLVGGPITVAPDLAAACGQTLILNVMVGPGAPQGSSVELACTDTYGQANAKTLTLSAGVAAVPAPGLAVTLEPLTPGACSLPADGSALARIAISADASAASVPVNLSASAEVALLGVVGGSTTLLATGGASAAEAYLRWVGDAPGTATVAVSAGPDYALSLPLKAVGAPAMSEGVDVPKGSTSLVTVSSQGRLATCKAFATAPSHTTVRWVQDESKDLIAGDTTMATDGCGQSIAFQVGFGFDAPLGASVQITCEDTHGQSTSTLFAAVAGSGGDVSGLDVQLAAAADGECYIPANGLGLAVADITADASATGAPVTVETSGLAILGSDGATSTSLMLTTEGDHSAATAYLKAPAGLTQDALGVVTVSAGGTFAQSLPLVVAVAPTASGGDANLATGETTWVTFETGGRFDTCSAYATVPAKTSVYASDAPGTDLLSETRVFDDTECGQVTTLAVAFEADAPVGAAVFLTCKDSFGQASERVITAIAPPAPLP